MYVRTFVVSLVLADTSKNVPARIRYINKWHDRKGYKLWNNPVEGTALKTKALLVCAETTEILCNKQNIIFRAYTRNHSCVFVHVLCHVLVRDRRMHALPRLHLCIVAMLY